VTLQKAFGFKQDLSKEKSLRRSRTVLIALQTKIANLESVIQDRLRLRAVRNGPLVRSSLSSSEDNVTSDIFKNATHPLFIHACISSARGSFTESDHEVFRQH
jgi:hypothetical protein